MTGHLDCGHEVSNHSDFTTGYGVTSDNRRICYQCCAGGDKQHMLDTGAITLYLVNGDIDATGRKEIINWPGSLRFPVRSFTRGHHNMARTRIDVWFNGPDGHVWHGTQYGRDTEIAHCKRTKDTWR